MTVRNDIEVVPLYSLVLVDRAIKGYDIQENSLTRIRFRKLPIPFWLVGFLFWLGAFLCLYLIHIYSEENGAPLFVIREGKHLVSYSIIVFMLVLGYLFIINGRVKTTILDKRTGTLIIAKHPIGYYLTCCRNLNSSKVKLYHLEDITNVRAAQRGINKGNINTLHYKIVIDFAN